MHKISKKLQKEIEKSLATKIRYEPIGHHDLGRHFVYLLVDEEENEYILKIYGKENRWCKEVNALNLVNRKIPCPQIIDKGKFQDETEWLITNRIPGVVLEKVWNDISQDNRAHILEDLGEILSIIHNCNSYSYYGPWKECGPGVINHLDFYQHRKNCDSQVIKNILDQDLPDKPFLMKAYNEMIKFYDLIYARENTNMCHHDFSARNTLVCKKNDYWEISGIIDFEHSYPNDSDIDFTDLYQTIFIKDPQYEYHFLKGYTKGRGLIKNFSQKVRYYLFNKGLLICSWSYNRAPKYYREGIELLEWLMDSKK